MRNILAAIPKPWFFHWAIRIYLRPAEPDVQRTGYTTLGMSCIRRRGVLTYRADWEKRVESWMWSEDPLIQISFKYHQNPPSRQGFIEPINLSGLREAGNTLLSKCFRLGSSSFSCPSNFSDFLITQLIVRGRNKQSGNEEFSTCGYLATTDP
jgi:hypothetical protein